MKYKIKLQIYILDYICFKQLIFINDDKVYDSINYLIRLNLYYISLIHEVTRIR